MDLWYLKIRIFLWRLSVIKKMKQMLLCSRGYHKPLPGMISTISYKTGRKKTKKVSYLHCINCNTYFFVNDKDKKKYIDIKNSFRSNMLQAFDILGGSKRKITKGQEGKVRKLVKHVNRESIKPKPFGMKKNKQRC